MNTPSASSWTVAVGDPTLEAWLITFGYFIGAYQCFKCNSELQHSKNQSAISDMMESIETSVFWIFSGCVLLVLGINKQLDLQTLFIQIFTDQTVKDDAIAAKQLGKKSFLVLFILSLGYALVVTYTVCKKYLKLIRLALIGLGFLLTYIVFRAATIHQFNGLTTNDTIVDQLMYFTEPTGLIALIFAATLFVRKTREFNANRHGKI